MEHLAKAGRTTLTLSQYTESLRTRHYAPRTFLLSFDDAYASLAEHAYPVLADLGFTATTFVITDYIGRTNDWDVPYAFRRLPHLDWNQIEHWRAQGFDFQSHSARHARLTWLEDRELLEDLERSRFAMTSRLGPEAGRAIAYPFGAADQRVTSAAMAAGYELGFGAGGGDGGVMRLSRTPVYMWDAMGIPSGLRDDLWGSVGRGAALVANRCAVGTSAMLALGRAGLGLLRAAPQRGREENRAG